MASDKSSPAHSSGESRAGPRPSRKPGSTGETGKRPVRIGKYEIIKHIATGGMGAVYRARDVETGQDVALKILPTETAAKPAMLERFRREARSAAKLQHENIVTVHDFGVENGAWFLAMEFVDGVDLHDYVKRKGALDPEEARQYVLQAARALGHASAHHIVHRDIKPSNLLLTTKSGKPVIKLTDFGLAREVSADEFRVTRAGTTVGTVDYMSPEQARDSSAADIRSDLYSLGTTWFHLLAAQAPFPEGGLGERLIKIMSERPPDVRELNARVSDETWYILSKLLEKDPANRYQTPADLIDDLEWLEGSAVARPRPRPARTAAKKPRASRPPDDTKSDITSRAAKTRATSAPSAPGKKSASKVPYVVAGVAALLVVVSIIVALASSKKQPATGKEQATVQPGPIEPGPSVTPVPRSDKTANKTPVEKEKPADPVTPIRVAKPHWPALYKPSEKIDVKSLRQEIEKPWAERSLTAGEPFIARVCRAGPASHRSLSEAVAAAPAGRAIIIEIHDNGPLFELPLVTEGRHLTIRAGRGYRPLLIWDLQATLERRRKEKKTDQPLVFLDVRKGSLHLEGLELALRWPDELDEHATLVNVSGGELEISHCTVSAAGKPREPITLAQFHATQERARCRFTRLFARATAMTALDLDAPAADVLFDGCLIVGGQPALLRIRSGAGKGPRLNLVRSTLVCNRNFLELKPVGELNRSPALSVLAWDSLLSRASAGNEGDLLTLLDAGDATAISWRAVNSLYAGWKNLLAGTTTLSADKPRDWRRQWSRSEGDEVVTACWPEQTPAEQANQPSTSLLPGKAVGFAASVDPDAPLGCDLAQLPPCRDNWLTLALDLTLTPADLPSDPTAPEVPNPGDDKYHGGQIDLSTTDLGTHLARILETKKPGPRIVLHLTGKGEHTCAPIRLKGSSLVLFFEEPTDEKKTRAVLKFSTGEAGRPLIEIEDGNLEIIAGVLKVPDLASSRGSHLIKVKGGDIKLYRTRLEGPQQTSPAGWEAAVALIGSGEAAADKARACAISECVILSSKAAVLLDGTGCRLALHQSLVVAGTDAVQLLPGADCKGRPNIQCSLQQSTLAARQAIIRLGDAEFDGPPVDPVIVSSRSCAFLNPFLGQKAGMIVYDGTALPRGLLIWQGDQSVLDQHLQFNARAVKDPLPAQREGLARWQRLWGSAGVRQAKEVFFLSSFEPKKWALERLTIRMPGNPGADLSKLGISAGKSR